MRRLTIQVRDGVYGRAAAGVPVDTERIAAGGWVPVAAGETDDDGTLTVTDDQQPPPVAYRLVVRGGGYYAELGIQPGISEMALVVAQLSDDLEGRVEITIGPCGCTVYAGL